MGGVLEIKITPTPGGVGVLPSQTIPKALPAANAKPKTRNRITNPATAFSEVVKLESTPSLALAIVGTAT